VTIVVPGIPVPWKRARKKGKLHFTDPKQAEHAEKIRAAARNAGFREAGWGPFIVNCRFIRPDIDVDDPRFGDKDNLAKLVADALEGIVWANDRCIVDGQDTKIWDPCGPAHTEIEIRESPVSNQTAADFRRILGSKPLTKLRRGRLQPSARNFKPSPPG
jgi:Holliday junction resolvase RusA-like endonuclease